MKILLSNSYLRLITTLLFTGLISLSFIVTPPSIYAASVTLIWKPYLQQLTDTSVIILWVTQTGVNPEVHYSTDTSFNLVVSGTTRPGPFGTQLHRVGLTGLQPNTVYNYKIYTDSQDLLPSEQLSFQTAPLTGSSIPFTFIVFGDYGWNSDSQKRLRDQMLLDSFNFILTTGDNAYFDGSYTNFSSNVFGVYQNLFSKVGLFPTLGNHDYHTDSGGPYLDIFELPQNAWRVSDHERYYSFDYGNVHFVALDSNDPLLVDDAAANDDMFDWLRNDLNQTTQPWKIVAFHHPAYSTGWHGSEADVQTKLVPIFEQYGVDVVFAGHDHIYQRSYPLKSGQVTTTAEGGVVYIVSGAGSQANYPCSDSAYWLATSYCATGYGIYSRITVNNDTLYAEAIDENGAILDSYTIKKYFDAPVTGVGISGPAAGLVGVGTSLIANTTPITATPPITYMWQATGQLSQTTVGYLSSNVIFTWPQTGTETITVTTINGWGIATDTYTIAIKPVTARIYLPLLTKP